LNSWPNVATNFPSITSQPMSQTVGCGGQASFSVTASGSPPLSYFWTVNGHSLAFPTTNSTLILSNVHFASGAQFVVTVSNALERIASEPAILTVTNPPMPLLSLICSPPFDHISWTDSCIPFTLYRTENVSDCITDWEPVQGALEVDGST